MWAKVLHPSGRTIRDNLHEKKSLHPKGISCGQLITASPADFFTYISSRLVLSNVWVYTWCGNSIAPAIVPEAGLRTGLFTREVLSFFVVPAGRRVKQASSTPSVGRYFGCGDYRYTHHRYLLPYCFHCHHSTYLHHRLQAVR